MKFSLLIWSFALLSGACASVEVATATEQQSAPRAPKSLAAAGSSAHFFSWLSGEWNNHEQVWQQQEAAGASATGKPDAPLAHLHQLFAPIAAPTLGEFIAYAQQSQAADPAKITRQRIIRVSPAPGAIKLEIYALPNESKFRNAHLDADAFNKLKLAQLKSVPNCEMLWRFDITQQAYTAEPSSCPELPAQALGAQAKARLQMSAERIALNNSAGLISRKVRYFSGWAYINRAGAGASRRDTKFSSQPNLLLHNEGQRIPLNFDDGSPTGYLLELSRLTYLNTEASILKLAVIDIKNGTSIPYVWADPEATRLGMNLGWLQLGLTEKEHASGFGFSLAK